MVIVAVVTSVEFVTLVTRRDVTMETDMPIVTMVAALATYREMIVIAIRIATSIITMVTNLVTMNITVVTNLVTMNIITMVTNLVTMNIITMVTNLATMVITMTTRLEMTSGYIFTCLATLATSTNISRMSTIPVAMVTGQPAPVHLIPWGIRRELQHRASVGRLGERMS